MTSRRTDVVVVGGGQAGLTAGYYLLRADIPFVILDAESRVGDVWRRRWDSLELFTTARYSELPGLRFPGDPERFPGKDEIADYLEQYARTLELPILAESRATALERLNGRYRVVTASGTHEAEHVIVATGAYQRPAVPPVAETLSPDVTQLHSADYRNPEQVGAAGRTVRFVGGRTLEVAGVVWATGFRPDYSWIHVPILDERGAPRHARGVTESAGLYFLGMYHQYSRGSALIGFVRADAAFIVDLRAARGSERDDARPS